MWYSYGLLRAFQGRTDEALDYIGRARELEPMTLLYGSGYATLLYYMRKNQEAIEYVRPVLASQPRFDQIRSVLSRALLETGDVEGALEQLPLRYSDVPVLSDDGLAYARAGQRDNALRQVERLERHRAAGYGVSYEIAIIHAARGQTDAACAALRGALEDHSPTLNWLRLDPRMESLRNLSCYSEVAQRLYE
jgi:Flp pilus assembly protein TadD